MDKPHNAALYEEICELNHKNIFYKYKFFGKDQIYVSTKYM